jgi:hypothetical protein
MSASYPTSVKSFTTKNANDVIQPSHVNDAQDEITAVETDLLADWTSFTPNFDNLTIGNGTLNGSYKKLGKTVYFYASFVMGTTSSVGGSLAVHLPVNAHSDYGSYGLPIGIGEAVHPATGGYEISLRAANASGIVAFLLISTLPGSYVLHSGQATTNAPFVWASGDYCSIQGTYRAA